MRPGSPNEAESYYKIARHYGWALRTVFDDPKGYEVGPAPGAKETREAGVDHKKLSQVNVEGAAELAAYGRCAFDRASTHARACRRPRLATRSRV